MAAATSSNKIPDPGSVLRNLCQLLLVKKQHQILMEQSQLNNESNRLVNNARLQNMLLPTIQQQQNSQLTSLRLPGVVTGKYRQWFFSIDTR